MELIVDGKNVLKPVDLSKNKHEIIQQRESISSEVSLTHFKEKVGLFRANVKGDDLNGLVTELQTTFSGINERVINMYGQLDTVFNTVEAIHKGSVEGVIVGLKSAQKAIEQAEYAIDQLAETLAVVQDFKTQLESNTEHLNDIDYIWDATQKMLDDITALEESVNGQLDVINSNIESLSNISTQISEIEHFSDIDLMYEMIQKSKKQIEENKKKSIDKIKEITSEIDDLKSFKEKIDKIEHLTEIDEVYDDFVEFKKNSMDQIKNLDDKVNGAIKSESEIISNLDSLKSDYEGFKKTLSSKISEIDDEIVDIHNFQTKLKGNLDKQEEQIVETNNRLLEIEKLNNEISLLKSRMKIMWCVIGGTASVMILQIIFNILGII